jgi:hypothetical protein
VVNAVDRMPLKALHGIRSADLRLMLAARRAKLIDVAQQLASDAGAGFPLGSDWRERVNWALRRLRLERSQLLRELERREQDRTGAGLSRVERERCFCLLVNRLLAPAEAGRIWSAVDMMMKRGGLHAAGDRECPSLLWRGRIAAFHCDTDSCDE